jgi:hypothetical protein
MLRQLNFPFIYIEFVLVVTLFVSANLVRANIITDNKRVFDQSFPNNQKYSIDDCIPLAFGDFNADKVVDIFCRNFLGNSIRVMLNDDRSVRSQEQYRTNITYVTAIGHPSMFIDISSRGIIYDVLAADFDGDSKLDLFVLYKNRTEQAAFNGGFLWGDRTRFGKCECCVEVTTGRSFVLR